MCDTVLPDDPQALKALIGELMGQIEARDQTLSSLKARIEQQTSQSARGRHKSDHALGV